MKAVIMAGGFGSRIQKIESAVPKPMIKVCDKPILQYQIENLRRCNIKEIIFVVGHLGSIIKEYFKDGAEFGVKITYYTEDTPLGTAGSLFKMQEELQEKEGFLLLCGDLIFNIDFNRFIDFHKKNNALASLMVHPNDHPFDSSIIVTKMTRAKKGDIPEDTHIVSKWIGKHDKRTWCKNLTNAGLEIISPELLLLAKDALIKKNTNFNDKIDLDKDVLTPAITTNKIFAYNTTEYVKDMGTPTRYYEVSSDIKAERVKDKCLINKQKAVFLDRDGTINIDKGFINTPKNMALIPGVAEAIKKINKAGYLVVVVTNQSVIARGEATFTKLRSIHNKMETLLGREGAYIDALYYCPHHTDKGFKGERIEYKVNCNCRKPNTALIEKACKELNIDANLSYMVGDSIKDIECGRKANCKESVLLKKGYTLLDFVNDYIK